MFILQQSDAITIQLGPFVDATDGVTEETGLTPASEISKAGAAFGAGPTGTHDAEGWYRFSLTGTHTNTLGLLVIKAQDSATHLPVWDRYVVVGANIYDSFIDSVDFLDVNLQNILNDGTSVVDLKDFVDSGYDPATSKVEAVKVVDSPSAIENADALLDRAAAIETGLTPRECLRLLAAASAGKFSGGGTTSIAIRNAVADTKNRITATVDANGNRSVVTTDVT